MRTCVAALVGTALLLSSFAIPASADRIFGGRAGVSVAKASVSSSVLDEKNRTGLAGTAFLSLDSGAFALQPEISYIQKGVKEVKLDYVELAALLKLGMPIIPLIEPHVLAGIGADYEVNDKTSLTVDTSKVDWNAIFGADVFIGMGKLAAVADARFALGLKDVNDAGTVVTELKNRAWLLSAGVGYRF